VERSERSVRGVNDQGRDGGAAVRLVEQPFFGWCFAKPRPSSSPSQQPHVARPIQYLVVNAVQIQVDTRSNGKRHVYLLNVLFAQLSQPSNLPNLRRLFVEARSEAEESSYSRNAVRFALPHSLLCVLTQSKFYNLVLFMSSVAVFSLVAQRMTCAKA
jgi:hypothetical protein